MPRDMPHQTLPSPADLEHLRSSATALGVDLSPSQLQHLLDYVALIAKWNRVYNLTAVRDPREMLAQHILDSLACVPALLREIGTRPFRLLDVGSGAGLPGVVIAIALPRAEVICVDTVAKKATFIQQVAAQLKLPTLTAKHARVENMDPAEADVVTSRAFASLHDFTSLSRVHLAPSGRWMAMKGKPSASELAELNDDLDVFHVEQLTVPQLDADRCLVWIRPVQPTLL